MKVASSNSTHRETPRWPVPKEGQHPLELRSPRISTGAGRSIKEGKHQPWERTGARMEVRLLGRAMLGQLVVEAINYDFMRTDLTGKLSEHIYAPHRGL